MLVHSVHVPTVAPARTTSGCLQEAFVSHAIADFFRKMFASVFIIISLFFIIIICIVLCQNKVFSFLNRSSL